MSEAANLDINSLVEQAESAKSGRMMSNRPLRKPATKHLRRMVKAGRPYWYWYWYVYENGHRIQRIKYAGTRKPREG